MTMDYPAQSQPVHYFLLFIAVAQALHTKATAVKRGAKISVPRGYKFSPSDEDLVNQHLKRKIMNLAEEHCLIPEYYHYDADPWDLIHKYNELSDGDSSDSTCFFYCINRSSERIHRKTPSGRWHETSGKMQIVVSDGVKYIMKYFTYRHRQKKGDTITWRMREFTDPSQKELSLCKIYIDLNSQKKIKDGCMPVSSPEAYADIAMESRTTSGNLINNNLVSTQLGPKALDEYQVPTPLSHSNMMTNGVTSTGQLESPSYTEGCTPSRLYDPLPGLNLVKNGGISHHHQQQMHIEEESPFAQIAFADQTLDCNNPRQLSDTNLVNDGVISSSCHPLIHTKEGAALSQNVSANQSLSFTYPDNTRDDEFSKDWVYSHNSTPNTSDLPDSKRQRDEGISLEVSQQPPMKKFRIATSHSEKLELPLSSSGNSLQHRQMNLGMRNFSSRNNSPLSNNISFTQGDNMFTGCGSEGVTSKEVASLFNHLTQPRNLDSSNVSSQHQLQVQQFHQIYDWCQETELEDLLASPSNRISLDDFFTTDGPDFEGHNDEFTTNFSTLDTTVNTTEQTDTEIYEAQQPIQEQASPMFFPVTQSPNQPLGYHSATLPPQQMDMPAISEEWSDIDDDHQSPWNC